MEEPSQDVLEVMDRLGDPYQDGQRVGRSHWLEASYQDDQRVDNLHLPYQDVLRVDRLHLSYPHDCLCHTQSVENKQYVNSSKRDDNIITNWLLLSGKIGIFM